MAEEEFEDLINDLSDTISDLRSEATFARHREYMGELDSEIPAQLERVARLREQGYVYKGFLEKKIERLQAKWEDARPDVKREIQRAERSVDDPLEEATKQLATAQRTRRLAAAEALQTRVEALEDEIDELSRGIDGLYSDIRTAYRQTKQQIDDVEWMIEQLNEATFELLAGESPIEAVEGRWWRDGKKDGPEGVLYLTDQRIIFEQKEKIAKKKVLFIATEKEMVQEKLFEAPVLSVITVVASKTGGLKKTRLLDFDLGTGADYAKAQFDIKREDPGDWAALIKRVKNGQIQNERLVGQGQQAAAVKEEDPMADAPEKCISCGAPVGLIAQGQRQISCEYCGTVMKW